MHWKHGPLFPGGQGERSHTPSGPSGSWHCAPGSVQRAKGAVEIALGSQATSSQTKSDTMGALVRADKASKPPNYELGCKPSTEKAAPLAAQ